MLFTDITDVTLLDDDTNAKLTDEANRAVRVRLRWLFRGFLAHGYIARYIWLYSQIYLAI